MEEALIISLIVNVVLIVLNYITMTEYDNLSNEWAEHCQELNNRWYEKCMNIINKRNKEE